MPRSFAASLISLLHLQTI
ncbi:hypothetical protein [Escherichia albertii]